MTYRDRRLAKAERLRGWAEGREAKADALHARNEPYRGDIAFNTQPGHIPERARVIARTEKAWEHSQKAREMARRADGIEAAADRAIYSDDPDACDALRSRIAELEGERDRWKAYNKSCKAKAPDRTLLAAAQRERLDSLARVGFLRADGTVTYTNLSANIKRNRDRLASLERGSE